MSEKQDKKQKRVLMMIFGGAGLAMLIIAGLVITLVFMEDPGARKNRIHQVTLLKPPVPKVEELPPPPPKQEEKVVEKVEPEESPEELPEEIDSPPAGELLGLDADGSAGGDDFGLVARKGGRSIIGGGEQSLLARYAWYTRQVKDELEKLVRRQLEEHGGVPAGELKAVIALRLDDLGNVREFRIIDPSGNAEMDTALELTLKFAVLQDPPPPEMPRVIKLRIFSQG